ncbi:hypothetical protein [Mucilaginibacter sp. L196]|uniref:hypothetical protein n=1 Tax=Mucilaginibacter sp. L196 TaxID=1641870 RepID=UPI00131D73B0|nr:hypothetical protein [Mucilaginibacter sp. L196]
MKETILKALIASLCLFGCGKTQTAAPKQPTNSLYYGKWLRTAVYDTTFYTNTNNTPLAQSAGGNGGYIVFNNSETVEVYDVNNVNTGAYILDTTKMELQGASLTYHLIKVSPTELYVYNRDITGGLSIWATSVKYVYAKEQ